MKLRRILAGLWIVLLLLASTCYAENTENPIISEGYNGYLRLNIPSVKKIEYYGRSYIECSYTQHHKMVLPYGIPIVEETGTYYCWFDPSDDKMWAFGEKHYDASKDYVREYLNKRDISGDYSIIYRYLLNNFPKLCDEAKLDNQKADEKYGSYLAKAFAAENNKDWEAEYAALKEAYDNGCQSQAILYDFYWICWKIGEYDNAIDWVSKRIEVAPSATAYNSRAWDYYLLGKNDLALEDAKWATLKDKDEASYLDTRGCIYYEMGQYDKAIKDFDAALKINDQYAHAYYYRGKCYEAIGKKNDAQSDYKKSNKYEPGLIDDKADFVNQRSQAQARKQQAQYQKREKYKEDLKKLNDAVYVHNNAQNFPAKVVFENDDIIITVAGNIKNNESEQFYQEVIPQEVRTNYESSVYQQQYEQLKAQVEAEQSAKQQAAARAAGYNLGVPVSINFDPNNLHWSEPFSYEAETGYNHLCDIKFSEAKIGEHLYLIKVEHSVQGCKVIQYLLRSTDDKIYAISYDYTYEDKNIEKYVKHDVVVEGHNFGRAETLLESDRPAHNFVNIPEGTVIGRKKHLGVALVSGFRTDNYPNPFENDLSDALRRGSGRLFGNNTVFAPKLGFEVNRAPDISFNQVYDLTDVYDRSGGFDENACQKAYEYALEDFCNKTINRKLDICRDYQYFEHSVNEHGYFKTGRVIYDILYNYSSDGWADLPAQKKHIVTVGASILAWALDPNGHTYQGPLFYE